MTVHRVLARLGFIPVLGSTVLSNINKLCVIVLFLYTAFHPKKSNCSEINQSFTILAGVFPVRFVLL